MWGRGLYEPPPLPSQGLPDTNQLFRQMCAESAVWEGPGRGPEFQARGLRGQGCVMRRTHRRAWVHARECVIDQGEELNTRPQ